MASLTENLINLRESRDWTKTYVARHIGLKNMQTYANWEYGKSEPDTEMLIKLADLYEVSIDYLLGKSDKKHYYDLNDKDTKDIAKQTEEIIRGLESNAEVNFDGEAITEEQRNSLREIYEMGLRINREKAKKKFTPKKYRGSEGGE